MRSSARAAIAVSLCFACAALTPDPSPAAAKTKTYAGAVKEGGTVGFKATVKTRRVRRHGQVKRIRTVTSILPGGIMAGVPIACDEGGTDLDWSFNGKPILVKKRGFYPSFLGEGVTFSGEFNKKGSKAAGIFRVQADFPPTAHGCDTGILRWTAKISTRSG